jgi:hypothetical protein
MLQAIDRHVEHLSAHVRLTAVSDRIADVPDWQHRAIIDQLERFGPYLRYPR